MNLKCIFCWVECRSLEELQAHSAICLKHPAVQECNKLKIEFAQLMQFLRKPRVTAVAVARVEKILEEAEKRKI